MPGRSEHALRVQERAHRDAVRALVRQDAGLARGRIRRAGALLALGVPVGADRKRCVVAYATRGQQHLWSVEMPLSATIGQALEAARAACGAAPSCAGIAWRSAAVGI